MLVFFFKLHFHHLSQIPKDLCPCRSSHQSPACSSAYFVRHQGGYGAADLMVVHVSNGWAEEDEQEAHRYRHLQHRLQQHCLLQTHKSHGRLVQEVHPTCGGSHNIQPVLDKITSVQYNLPNPHHYRCFIPGVATWATLYCLFFNVLVYSFCCTFV